MSKSSLNIIKIEIDSDLVFLIDELRLHIMKTSSKVSSRSSVLYQSVSSILEIFKQKMGSDNLLNRLVILNDSIENGLEGSKSSPIEPIENRSYDIDSVLFK